MNFDSVTRAIGEFGLYQKRIYFLMCILGIIPMFFMLNGVFILAVPKHRCALPGYENDTYEVQSDYHRELINVTIPTTTDDFYDYEECHLYDVINGSVRNSDKKLACSSWVYDDTVFSDTFSSQENLVCEDSIKTSHAQMVFYAGVLVGSFGLGALSDKIGRKNTLMMSVVGLLASGLGVAFAHNFALFCVLRFLVGFFCPGVFLTKYVLGMELVGPSKRLYAGLVVAYFGTIGEIILAGIGYGVRHWKYIEITCAAPLGLFLVYWWLVPESPRWLIAHGRYQEATKIIEKAAKVNKVNISKSLLDITSIEEPPKGNIWQLFATPALLKRTLIIFFNWMVVSMVFYGIALNTGNLGGDFYLNFLLLAIVELPGHTLCILTLDRFGRKKIHLGFMFLGGLSCICTIFTTLYGGDSLEWLTIALAMIGKMGATAAFQIMYIWSAELFPTVVRNAGIGASSSWARVGSMIAPYIADLNDIVSGDIGHALPLVIFGSASVLAGLMALALPETLNRNLPETIEDGENFDSSKYKLIEDSV